MASLSINPKCWGQGRERILPEELNLMIWGHDLSWNVKSQMLNKLSPPGAPEYKCSWKTEMLVFLWATYIPFGIGRQHNHTPTFLCGWTSKWRIPIYHPVSEKRKANGTVEVHTSWYRTKYQALVISQLGLVFKLVRICFLCFYKE